LTLDKCCGIDTRRFSDLSTLVALASGSPLPIRKPITGEAVFRHESGIHVHGLLADRRTYEPFVPESVGRRGTEIVLGKHSGTAAIRHVLMEEGIHISVAEAADLLTDVRTAAFREKCLASPAAASQDLVSRQRKELLKQPATTASL
jgi:homocitrate synthase NifV